MESHASASVRDIIGLWPTQVALASALGFKADRIEKWCKRDRIPAEHHFAIVQAARRSGIEGVTFEVLARAHGKT